MSWPPTAAVVVCAAVLLMLSPATAHAQRATINGVVLGPSGAPEPNITLIVTNSAGVDRRVVTDVTGAFVIGGLQPGPYRIRTDNDTFAPFSQEAIVLAAGQVFSMKIGLLPRLPPTAAPTARAAVQGTVLGPDGVPAGNIALIITNAEGIDRRVVTGPNGAFVFGGLQPGPYRLRIEDAGPGARPFPATEIVFGPGERRQFDVRLQPLPPPPPPAVTAAPAAAPTPAAAAPQGRSATLPVAESRDEDAGDFSYPVPEVTAPGGEFESWPNRWDFQFPRFQRYENNRRMPWIVGSPFDPYNQNGAKGDFPVFGSQSLFANLTLQLNSTINPRQVGAGEDAPTSQTFDNHNFVGGLELFRGATVFQPKSWAVRATVVGNMNGLRTGSDSARGTTYGVEEAFVEKRLAVLNAAFDFVSVRAGMQNFNSDFRGYLFADNQLGVRLFGNAASNRHQYNVAYFDMRNRDAASQLHRFSSRQQRVIIANYYIQDFGAPGYTAMFNLHLSRDEKDETASPQQVTYAGFHGDGRWGAWSVSHAFYQAFGTDSNNVIARQLDADGPSDINISAQMAAIELSRDADWLRYRFSAFYASGDDRSDPGTARGFDTITDNPNLAGGQFMYWTQQKSAVALGESPQIISEKFSLLPNLRSKFGDRANFVNPGLMLVNGGLDMRLSPVLKLVTNASLLRFADATILRSLAGANPGFEDAAIGIDLGFGAKYRPLVNENMFVVLGYSMLLPQGGFKSAIGSTGRLHSLVGAVQFAY